jgi:ABC-type lipoprotein release transport system permease subunit
MILKVGLLGLLIGPCGSFAVEHMMRSYVFRKFLMDAVSLVGVVLVLSAVALLATWMPARRAEKLAPVTALRHET